MTKCQTLIAVDIGNSTVKCCSYSDWNTDTRPVPIETVRESCDVTAARMLEAARLLTAGSDAPAQWCIASVNSGAENQVVGAIARCRPSDRFHRLSNHEVPIKANVDHPDRVGIDRLLAAVAANDVKQSDHAAIVIDVGSAVTVDFVSSDGVFQGGAILPGIQLQADSLARGTDGLPTLDLSGCDTSRIIGKSTEQAIGCGVCNGLVGAVKEIVARMRNTTPAEVFITGGDMNLLKSLERSETQFIADLVPLGIALSFRKIAGGG